MSTIKISFAKSYSRVGSIELPWVKGSCIKTYLHHPGMRYTGVLGSRANGRYKITNQRNEMLRMVSVPQPGDHIIFYMPGK